MIYKTYVAICVKCGNKKHIGNTRGVCKECVYKENHGGKSEREVYYEKQNKKNKESDKAKERRERDERFYEYLFNTFPPVCKECGKTLNVSFRDNTGKIINKSQYSHYFSKGAYPEFRHNIYNGDRLCFKHHQQWEFGDKKSMYIYNDYLERLQKIKDNINDTVL